MLNIKYIRKEIESILIPPSNDRFHLGRNRYNPRFWTILKYQNDIAREDNERILNRKFFTFIYIGNNFPIIFPHKEILPLLKKYKFSKVYVSRKSDLWCYYFKRGVLFQTEFCRDTKDKKIVSLVRLFKLLKLKTN
jgi:hypothetical protein